MLQSYRGGYGDMENAVGAGLAFLEFDFVAMKGTLHIWYKFLCVRLPNAAPWVQQMVIEASWAQQIM
eukprot:scaffold319284_cov21-Tisochrysis_lutea.AAC.1